MILVGDCREQLRTLPDQSVHCCVTSPPYWGLRDYGTATWEGGDAACDHTQPPRISSSTLRNDGRSNIGTLNHEKTALICVPYKDICGKCGARRIDSQLGLEPTPAEYVAGMVAVFREVRRVLRDDGTCWVNLGDSYAGGGGHSPNAPSSATSKSGRYGDALKEGGIKPQGTIKPKDLCGIPWRVAFALQADGWYLRQDIIWHKPNPMPESVTDRCTKAHEYIFLLSKSERYYFDAEAIAEKAAYAGEMRGGSTNRYEQNESGMDNKVYNTRNKRSVWTVHPAPFKGAHFATYPPKLIEPCILAGCPEKCCAACAAPVVNEYERAACPNPPDGSDIDRFGNGDAGVHRKVGQKYQDWLDANPKRLAREIPSCACNAGTIGGTVIDPFLGAGTTAVVAEKWGRKWIGCELNPEYAEIARKRIAGEAAHLFAGTAH